MKKNRYSEDKRSIKFVIILILVIAASLAITFWIQKNTWKNEGLDPAKADTKISGICQEIEPEVKKISHKEKNIYSEKYQKESDDEISKQKKEGNYSFEQPLVIENAYGTYTTSLYYYAETDTPSSATCKIMSEGAATIEQTLETVDKKGFVTQHEYNIIGLVPGQENEITLEFYNEKKELIGKTSFSYTPAADEQIPEVLEVHNGESRVAMSDGFYTLLGHDKSTATNVYFFDNEGKTRGRIPLNDYRTDRLLFVGNEMVYSYDINKIAFVNRLGKVERTVEIEDYEFHHDFIHDEKQNSIVILANKKGADTIEDRVLALDCKTGKVKELVDFVNLMPEFRKSAIQRADGKNTYGGTELDWIHFNSLDMIGDGEVILSSREHSSLIKVSDIYGSPKIDYIIHGGSLYKGTKYETYQLKKKGDFVGQAGQHTITVEKDESLPENQYYLYMFNNNFGNAATIPSFDWSLYPGAGKFAKGDHSCYYKYLVDEEKRTYELVNHFELPYSSIVSSVEHIGDNISFSSGMSKCFGEYDKEGKMIRTVYYDADKYSYRVLKYNFHGFYYR